MPAIEITQTAFDELTGREAELDYGLTDRIEASACRRRHSQDNDCPEDADGATGATGEGTP